MSEYNFFQPTIENSTTKMSNFGANVVGPRMGSDYTRTSLGFADKDNLSDQNVITEDTGMGQNVDGRSINIEHNPYLIGSSLKRTRDDQLFRMEMTDNRGTSIDMPKFDVMDRKTLDATGMVAGKNWPSEGWRSFGGKYDFIPYQGGGVH